MKFKEELLWILDEKEHTFSYKKIDKNIDFVHSLGLKCDCVGWSELMLDDPRADEILKAIDDFCKKEGYKARGFYKLKFAEEESEWYHLDPVRSKDSFMEKTYMATGSSGNYYSLLNVRAYKELSPAPRIVFDHFLVPERFRNFCIKNGIEAEFCWARDKGKYKAEQYFEIYPGRNIPHNGNDPSHGANFKELATLIGHSLPKIAEVFHELTIRIPQCYLRSDMPKGGIVGADPDDVFKHTVCFPYRNILIHKDTAAKMLEEKVISRSVLKPAMMVDSFPAGWRVIENSPYPVPDHEIIERLNKEYEELKAKDRPVYTVTEKDALKLMRSAKKERKEDFAKALTKKKCEEAESTCYSALVPYYKVANGGLLSDEYELLSMERSIDTSQSFRQELEAEGLLENKPEGIVIAKCIDGDKVLLCEEQVIRFSHEAPEIAEHWQSLAQFIAEAIAEN